MTKLEIALMIIAATLLLLTLIKLLEVLALMGLNALLDRIAGDRRGLRVTLDEAGAAAIVSAREKLPDANLQAHADQTSRAPLVKMAAATLERRRSEATK